MKILIIKHGALGDWILATGGFHLIRNRYPFAHISLLTNSQYVSLAKKSNFFDDILIDDRQGAAKTLLVLNKLRKNNFTHIYDMQKSQRTSIYYFFLKRSAIYWEKFNEFSSPYIPWLKTDVHFLKPKNHYVLIIPGCSKHRPQKRWTVEGYVLLINWFSKRNISSLLIGTEIDQDIIEPILKNSTDSKNFLFYLSASLDELAELARGTLLCIGSDTGPMHIAAAAGAQCLTLFCNKESSVKNKTPGAKVSTIEVDDLGKLNVNSVISKVETLLNECHREI